MKTYIVVVALAVFGLVGCSKASQQAASTAPKSFTLSEADTLMAQSTENSTSQASTPELAAGNIVVNNEVSLVSAVSSEPVSSDFPDETAIQQALKNLGLYQGEVDGKVGPKTREAVREFQKQNNLVADGKVGPKTWALLKKGLEQASTAAASSTGVSQ